jgi:hypothetical protein
MLQVRGQISRMSRILDVITMRRCRRSSRKTECKQGLEAMEAGHADLKLPASTSSALIGVPVTGIWRN